MLRKIVKFIGLIFKGSGLKQMHIFFLLLMFLNASHGCISIGKEQPNEEALRKKVNQFYNHWIHLEYDKCVEFLVPGNVKDKKGFINELNQIPYKVVGYEIESVEINGYNAKVHMVTTKIEDNEKSTGKYYDCWSYSKDRWYLDDFGRSDGGEDTVKEYKFDPEKFK